MTTSIMPTPDVAAPANWTPGEFALRDAWFPVAHLYSLTGLPLRRLVHSLPYYLWKDEGRLRATNIHPAANGPSAEMRDYVAIARYGYAWVWYGDTANADPALIPDIPFLRPERSPPRYASDTNFFHCTYELVLENILDLTHIDYVHRVFSGPEDSDEDSIRFESTSETVTMVRTIKGKQTSAYQRDVLGITEPYQDQEAFTHVFIRSGVCFLHSHYSSAPSMPLMQTNTPESRYITRANVTFGVEQCSSPIFRRAWPKTGPIVARQDEDMLDPQNVRYVGAERGVDLSTRFDGAGLQFRARYNALVERQKRGDTSYLPDIADGSDLVDLLKIRRL